MDVLPASRSFQWQVFHRPGMLPQAQAQAQAQALPTVEVLTPLELLTLAVPTPVWRGLSRPDGSRGHWVISFQGLSSPA